MVSSWLIMRYHRNPRKGVTVCYYARFCKQRTNAFAKEVLILYLFQYDKRYLYCFGSVTVNIMTTAV